MQENRNEVGSGERGGWDRVPRRVLGCVEPGREVVHLLVAVHEVVVHEAVVVVAVVRALALGALAGSSR